jgi:hypothetical protein
MGLLEFWARGLLYNRISILRLNKWAHLNKKKKREQIKLNTFAEGFKISIYIMSSFSWLMLSRVTQLTWPKSGLCFSLKRRRE